MKKALIALIRGYRSLSSARPPTCRFQPTCSSYAIDALETHGLGRGLGLALRRIFRCHPMGDHGWDPVPPHGDALNA